MLLKFIKKYEGWILTFLCVVSVGIFPLSYKKLSDASPNFTTTLLAIVILAFIFNTIFSTIFTYKEIKEKSLKLDYNIWIYILPLGLLTIVGNLLFLIAIQDISPGIAQLVQRTEIIFVLYLSWFFFKDKVTVRLNFTVLLIILGIVFLKWEANFLQFLKSFTAILYAIISGLIFAIMQLMIQFSVKKYSPNIINFLRLLFACIFLIMFVFFTKTTYKINSEIIIWGAISAFLGPFFARLCYSYACKTIPISKIVLLTPLAPVFTLVFQWWLLDISINFREIVGSIIVISGIYLALKYR